MVMQFTTEDHARVSQAIADAEARTSGEIYCVAAREVSSYRDVPLAWAAAAALILPMGLVAFGFSPPGFPGFADSWEAAHTAARDVTVGGALAGYAVLQAATFLGVFTLVSLPGVRFALTPRVMRRARVRRAALHQFLSHGLQFTEDRTGVLIFAALADHRVEIIADKGIHGRVDDEVWADAVEALTRELKAGRPAEGFEAAIRLCGQVLADKFPPQPMDRNELADRLVVL